MLPRNSLQLIRRVMNRFKLDAGMYLTIVATSPARTPTCRSTSPRRCSGILGTCVELQATATRADIEAMADYTDDPAQQAELLALTGDDEESHARYRQQVREPNVSVLDLLERYPACTLPFPVYLDLLPALQPAVLLDLVVAAGQRRGRARVTDGVLRAPARRGDGEFDGVCSTYLADDGTRAAPFSCSRREPTIPFRPPADPAVPMIMVGAGTGLAPFRGFLQERAAQKERGGDAGAVAAVLRLPHPRADRLYADELRAFEQSADVQRVHGLLARADRRPQVRATRDARPRRRDLGPGAAQRHDLRVRQRAHPRRRACAPRSLEIVDRQDRCHGRRGGGVARRPARATTATSRTSGDRTSASRAGAAPPVTWPPHGSAASSDGPAADPGDDGRCGRDRKCWSSWLTATAGTWMPPVSATADRATGCIATRPLPYAGISTAELFPVR